MANYCTNILLINGSSDEIKKFYYLNSINDNNGEMIALLLDTLVSQPKNLKDEDIGQWRQENWGVSGEIGQGVGSDATVDISGLNHGSLTYTFDTNWRPPIAWLAKVQKLFPNLIFSMMSIEPGNNNFWEANTTPIDAESGLNEIIVSQREMELEDHHYFGGHEGIPEADCDSCGIEDFEDYHQDHGLITEDILQRCVICRHERGLEHQSEACPLCAPPSQPFLDA